MKKNSVNGADILTLARSYAKDERLTDLEFGIVCIFLCINFKNVNLDSDFIERKFGLTKMELLFCFTELVHKGILVKNGDWVHLKVEADRF